jgi:peptidoglycan hydrolase-like protein with peptidoglycan-binding domain
MRYTRLLFVAATGALCALALAAAPAAFAARATVAAAGQDLALGEQGPQVSLLQDELSALHYVVGAPGVYDARTARAVLAFRKMTGMARNDVADPEVFAKLAEGEGAFTVRYPGQGRHVEGDLTHLVLALIDAGGHVEALYPMSSGKPSTPTQLGTFSVYMQEYGTNNDGMVNSSFFNGGDAIHGYAEVPAYAASHGCLRVPIPDSLTIRNWVEIGTTVDVYYR